MNEFLSLKVENDRLIVVEEVKTTYIAYDEIPEEIKESLNQIIFYAKDTVEWKS